VRRDGERERERVRVSSFEGIDFRGRGGRGGLGRSGNNFDKLTHALSFALSLSRFSRILSSFSTGLARGDEVRVLVVFRSGSRNRKRSNE
jgi:hypothetical protein